MIAAATREATTIPSPAQTPQAIANRIAREIANAADADQFAIAVVGLSGLGPPDFEELVPRPYLIAMNDGRPAAYRITLVLRTADADLGTIRLGTICPSGFSAENIRRARVRSAAASAELAAALRQSSTRAAA